ncbi:MAG: tetratricopeptide repeat protein [Deferrisomatales bacterium]
MSQNPAMRRLSSGWGRVVVASTLLAALLTVLPGCATFGTVPREPAVAGPAPPAEPVGPSVTPLPDGSGFVIREVPNLPEEWEGDFAAALDCLDRQDYAGAVALLQKVIAQEPGVTAPYTAIALAYRELDQPGPAEESLKKALELFPAHPVAGNAYGLLLRRGGRFAEARTVYEQVLARFPDYAPAHRNLGILCELYLNDLECALGQYELYHAANPGDEQAIVWLADLRQRLRQ